jgi:hypothetical protein
VSLIRNPGNSISTKRSNRCKRRRTLIAQRFGLLRSISIEGNARCNRSYSASRCRSACVGGSGPQTLSTIANLTDVTAYSIRPVIHDPSRGNPVIAVIFDRIAPLNVLDQDLNRTGCGGNTRTRSAVLYGFEEKVQVHTVSCNQR